MENEILDYYPFAIPEVTDDDGYLGYLWQGILFLGRDANKPNVGDFEPAFKTESLYYHPKDAIDAVTFLLTEYIANKIAFEK